LYNYSPQHETSSIVASSSSKVVDDDDDNNSSSYYPPKPLASNISSRETQFDLDSDELDTDYYNEDGAAPLMEGLLDHPRAKRGSLDLRGEDRRLKALERDAEEHEPPDWLTRGGGVWAGIANMSNSILGAGIIGKFPFIILSRGRDEKAIFVDFLSLSFLSFLSHVFCG
jgi:sodium-coupled neutral amino acid transporter 11